MSHTPSETPTSWCTICGCTEVMHGRVFWACGNFTTVPPDLNTDDVDTEDYEEYVIEETG